MCCGGDKKYGNADYADPNYEGEPADSSLSEGPFENRSCTDILCCLFFIAFLGGMGYVANIGLATGKPL